MTMARRTGKPFTLTAAERAAIEQAQHEYLRLLEVNARHGWRDPERAAFVALRRAARAMAAALGPFEQPSPEQAHLLYLLQQGQALKPQDHYRRMLEALGEPLYFLAAACDDELGDGRGQQRNPAAARWACLLASAWAKRTGARPTAAEHGRFWRAIEHAQEGHDANLALAPQLPRLSRDQLRAVLPRWLHWHRLAGGKSTG